MAYLAISTRKIIGRRDARRFGDEPAPAAYLSAPENAGAFKPEHAVSSPERWAKLVLADLPKDSEGRPSGDLVFLVHGYNVDAADAYRFHATVAKGLNAAGFPHVLVSYDWPARGSFLNYLEDSQDANRTAPHLVTSGIALFAQFTAPDCRTRVHVLAHSMGAQVAREAFRQAEGHPPASMRAWGLAQLVLVAADISAGSLADNMSWSMRDKAQRVTNYYSKFDAALATSNIKRFGGSPRAGRHGAPQSMLGEIADVDCSDRWGEWKKTGPGGAIDELKASHTWYFQDQDMFYPDLAATLAGDVDRTRIATRDDVNVGAGRLRLKPQK